MKNRENLQPYKADKSWIDKRALTKIGSPANIDGPCNTSTAHGKMSYGNHFFFCQKDVETSWTVNCTQNSVTFRINTPSLFDVTHKGGGWAVAVLSALVRV